MNNVGSIWQRWDLHVHTPASFHWKGPRFDSLTPVQQDDLCKAILDKINSLDIVAFCIMDYWTFEGYIRLRDYIQRNPGSCQKTIFPGIELRMAAPTDFRLNTHVLLSDEVIPERLNHFISNLRLADQGTKPPTRSYFIELGRSFEPGILKQFGYNVDDRTDESKMLLVGQKSALVTRDSVKEAIAVVGGDSCLVIQPYDTSDGLEDLDWKRHPYTDSYLMKWADCFETRNQDHVDLFLGKGHKSNKLIGPQFIENIGGRPKPVFSGSDAHRISDYGVFPSGRATWLKAQPTFLGLKQLCCEPTLRCYIGDRPAKLRHVDDNPTKYIKSISIRKVDGSNLDERWFDSKTVHFNSGLVAVVGNRGSGKSALADIIALAGNSHCSHFEFLNTDRFRGVGNKAQQFLATLTWADNTTNTVNLADDFDPRLPERVRYLPQHFIEDLCNEIVSGDDTNFGKELQKVIFDHIPSEHRLEKGTLKELLEYRLEAHRTSSNQLRQTLQTVNNAICRNETDSSEESVRSLRTALSLKESELAAIDLPPLDEVHEPVQDPNDSSTQTTLARMESLKSDLSTLETRIASLTSEKLRLSTQRALLNRLIGHVDNFKKSYFVFVDSHRAEFDSAGLKIDEVVRIEIHLEELSEALRNVTVRIGAIEDELNGTVSAGGDGRALQLIADACAAEIAQLQDGLRAPEKAYREYLNELTRRRDRRQAINGSLQQVGSIEFLRHRIAVASKDLPEQLGVLRAKRRSLMELLHKQYLAMREVYEELYAPLQSIASAASTASQSVQIEFDASIVCSRFESDFLDFIHRGRRGSFYGEDESHSLVRELVRAHDFSDTGSVVSFIDSILQKLSVNIRDGKSESLSIETQLRDRSKLNSLYNFLFGLEYLDIRYNLRLGGKDITQLSPGEKGALLLVFYLLLDTEEIPIIIDQPELNLDNESVVRLLVDCIRDARARRQVVIVTHNPNLAVYCDSDQIICCSIDKTKGYQVEYSSGAIEDYDINRFAVNVLEGTYPAFDNRRRKWHKPVSAESL